MVALVLKMSPLSQGETDEGVVKTRLSSALGLALRIEDWRSFIELVVKHLDVRYERSHCTWDLYRVREFLRNEMPERDLPPELPVTRGTAGEFYIRWGKGERMQDIKDGWLKWVSGADTDRLDRAMKAFVKGKVSADDKGLHQDGTLGSERAQSQPSQP
jgi:hypothetical protein